MAEREIPEGDIQRTQTVVFTKLGPGRYRFAVRGDFSSEELTFALDQLKAVLQGVATHVGRTSTTLAPTVEPPPAATH
jgi:hypothetical protein